MQCFDLVIFCVWMFLSHHTVYSLKEELFFKIDISMNKSGNIIGVCYAKVYITMFWIYVNLREN